MTAEIATSDNTALTFPILYFGGGLERDDRFVVERFPALACVDIRPVECRGPTAKGRRKTQRIVASCKEADGTRLERTELVTGTCLRAWDD